MKHHRFALFIVLTLSAPGVGQSRANEPPSGGSEAYAEFREILTHDNIHVLNVFGDDPCPSGMVERTICARQPDVSRLRSPAPTFEKADSFELRRGPMFKRCEASTACLLDLIVATHAPDPAIGDANVSEGTEVWSCLSKVGADVGTSWAFWISKENVADYRAGDFDAEVVRGGSRTRQGDVSTVKFADGLQTKLEPHPHDEFAKVFTWKKGARTGRGVCIDAQFEEDASPYEWIKRYGRSGTPLDAPLD